MSTPALLESAGTVRLLLPNDWLDLVHPGASDDEARAATTAEVRRIYPRMDPDARGDLIAALHDWRSRLRADGVVSHGVVAGRDDEDEATWQVMSGVVEVPISTEVDLSVLLARLLDHQLKDAAYVETFTTAMGLGIGVVMTPEVSRDLADGLAADLRDLLPPSAGLDEFPVDDPVHYGLAAALSMPTGGGYGLLVIGTSADPEQVRELAAVVAMIAGHSTVEPAARAV